MPTKLGQNFLKDGSVVKKIIESANLKPDDFIIEIGPGKGILTEALAKHVGPPRLAETTTRRREAGKVLAIEIDSALIPELKDNFRNKTNIEIINADILKINISELIGNKTYKVIANIPYYITSKIIRLFLESENSPQEMILMVQKEVAERIVANPGQMSVLAISVQYYADAEIIFPVDKNSFEPIPEVDSAVIKITTDKKRGTKNKNEIKKFFQLVKAGFSAKRKTLANNLANSLHLEKSGVEEKLIKMGLKSTVRAQELSVENWKKLTELF